MKRFLGALCLVMFAGLSYVYYEIEAVKIGYTIRKLEEVKVQSLDRTRALKYNVARLKAPNSLERRLRLERILLQSPKSWQTLVLTPAGAKSPAAGRALMARPPFFSRFLVGTAQAEAKESS